MALDLLYLGKAHTSSDYGRSNGISEGSGIRQGRRMLRFMQPTSHPTPRPATSLRRLVLVDLENLSGVSPRWLSRSDIEALAASTRRLVSMRTGNDVIVATNPAWRRPVERVWSGADLRFRGGPDGADIALCSAATDDRLRAARELWILSGDGRFAEPARRARRLGLRIVVTCLNGSLARKLKREAHAVQVLRRPQITTAERWAA